MRRRTYLFEKPPAYQGAFSFLNVMSTAAVILW